MTDEPFGRQPKPVHLTFTGEDIDIDHYARWIMQVIENGSYANVIREHNTLTIYPGAVND
jgi:hypothetical protein